VKKNDFDDGMIQKVDSKNRVMHACRKERSLIALPEDIRAASDSANLKKTAQN